MTDALSRAFWAAVDDLNAGRVEPIEDYLRLVPSEQKQALESMLVEMLVERGPAIAPINRDSDDYAAALAAIDEVTASVGLSGVLPGALKTMRHARGIERDQVLQQLATDFGITSERGRKALRRRYHALESSKLLGSKISHRLLGAIAEVFSVDIRDLIDAASSTTSSARPRALPALGRGAGHQTSAARDVGVNGPDRRLPADGDEQLVDRLFCGGPDA